MACVSHADSCSTMAQTSAPSRAPEMECFAAAARASAMSSSVGMSAARLAVEVNPADRWLRSALDSLLVAQLHEQIVDVRQVVGRHVLDEDAVHFLVAEAAVEPGHKQHELRGKRTRDP